MAHPANLTLRPRPGLPRRSRKTTAAASPSGLIPGSSRSQKTVPIPAPASVQEGVMIRLATLLLGCLLLMGAGCQGPGASPKAQKLRQAQGLAAFTPPEKFLAGNFVADEMNPAFIFGTVRDFAASRKCRATWLVEEGVKERLAAPAGAEAAAEYTLYLEEDCQDRVVHYVFLDQSRMSPQQWLEWRRQFHKSKAEPQFGGAKAKLEQACQEGCEVRGELRYILKDGELVAKSPEEVLSAERAFAPVYDLNRQQKLDQ